MIEDGAAKPVMLHEDERVLERVGGGDRSARGFKFLRDIQCDQGLILHDEDRAPL